MSDPQVDQVNVPTYTTTKGATQAAFDPSQVASTGAPNYEGTPTEYYDKSGNLIGYLGKGNTVQSTSGLNWMNPNAPVTLQSNYQLTDDNGNLLYQNPEYQPSTDPASQMYITQGDPSEAAYAPLAGMIKQNAPSPGLLQDPLFRNFALSAAALGGGAALAGAGGAAGGAEAFPVSMSDSITMSPLEAAATGADGSSAIMDSVAQGLPASASSPLTMSDALKYAKLASTGLGLANTLSGGAQGSNAAQGSSTGNSAQTSSANGPWNTPISGQNLTWAKQNEAPVTAGDSKLSMLFPSLDPALARQLALNGNTGSNLGGNFFAYGSNPQATQPMGYKDGGGVLQSFKEGGSPHIPEFITGTTGHYVKGRGDGQADLIPAMLADGEYVVDSSAVSTLGNGSSDSGAKLLDAFRESLREHTRSAPKDKIPPKASPLMYMKEAMKKVGMK